MAEDNRAGAPLRLDDEGGSRLTAVSTVLSREATLRTAREWLGLFFFSFFNSSLDLLLGFFRLFLSQQGTPMQPIDNLVTLHAEEERLRGAHLALTAGNEELTDHIHIICEAMNMLWAFTHDYARKNDDELTIQFLGIRLFNAAGSSIKLAHSGYYQNAFSALRDFLETFFLVDFLVSYPDKVSQWKTADEKALRNEFGPAAIRDALDKRDGFKEKNRKKLYDRISHHATHATPSGFKLTLKDSLGEIGPFYRPNSFISWAQEAVKMICNSGVVYGAFFKDVDLTLLRTKEHYIGELDRWKVKYFGSPAASSP